MSAVGGIQGLSNVSLGFCMHGVSLGSLAGCLECSRKAQGQFAQAAQDVSNRESMKAQTANRLLDEKFDRAASGIAQSPELTAAQHLEQAHHHLLRAQKILDSVK